MKGFRRSRKGQGTLEYILVLAAVIGALILIAGNIKTGVEKTGTESKAAIENAATKLSEKLK